MSPSPRVATKHFLQAVPKIYLSPRPDPAGLAREDVLHLLNEEDVPIVEGVDKHGNSIKVRCPPATGLDCPTRPATAATWRVRPESVPPVARVAVAADLHARPCSAETNTAELAHLPTFARHDPRRGVCARARAHIGGGAFRFAHSATSCSSGTMSSRPVPSSWSAPPRRAATLFQVTTQDPTRDRPRIDSRSTHDVAGSSARVPRQLCPSLRVPLSTGGDAICHCSNGKRRATQGLWSDPQSLLISSFARVPGSRSPAFTTPQGASIVLPAATTTTQRQGWRTATGNAKVAAGQVSGAAVCS